MAMHFPILVGEIELDASAGEFTVDPDGRVREIGTGFTIPSAKLHDLDLFARCSGKQSPEISCKPARLQFEFCEIARNHQKRALANSPGGEKPRVTGGGEH